MRGGWGVITITAKLNADGFMGKMRALASARRIKARTTAAAAGALVFTETIMQNARRDTNRYVRGWAIASNEAGLPAIAVPAVQRSKYADTYLKILGDQVDAFAWRVAQLERLIEERFRRTGRAMRGVYYQELYRKLEGPRGARMRLERAREELAMAAKRHAMDAPDYLFIGLYNKDGIYTPIKGARTKGRTARQLATIRTKVYGGAGRVVVNDAQSVFILRNLEPHASILESRWHYAAMALRMARSTGVSRMSAKYVSGAKAIIQDMKGGSNG